MAPTLRRLAAKVRAYLVQPLEALLWQLHQDTDSKLESVALKFVNNDRSRGSDVLWDQRLTASVLAELLQHVRVLNGHWSACEVIVACPFTVDSVKAIFGEKKCVCLKHSDDLNNMLNGISAGRVGVISPWLLRRLLESTDGPYRLLRACRELLCIFPADKISDEISTRKILHEVGFYEVSRLKPFDGEDFLSVGCLPDGSFRLFSSTIGLAEDLLTWKTLKASRLPQSLEKQLLWSSILLEPLVEAHLGFVAANGGTGLIVTGMPASGDGNFTISGTFRWEKPDSSHASLVACYRGPSDSSMVCATVQVLSRNKAILLIVAHDDVWRTLAETPLPHALIQTSEQGFKEVEIWLNVSEGHIEAGCNDQTLIKLNNRELKLAPVGGVRVTGKEVGISNVSLSNSRIRPRQSDL